MEPDDRALVERSKEGDQQAFNSLVTRYQRKVFSIAFSMVRDREEAMDLSQEAFLKVYRYLHNFQGTSSFYTWLYRIVVNLCIDHIRKSGRYSTVDYDDRLKKDGEVEGEENILPSKLDTNPVKTYARQELIEQIQAALEKLSDIHRLAIILREVEGLSYAEIADVMQVSKGTVMSRLHHARRNLQKNLHDYLEGSTRIDD